MMVLSLSCSHALAPPTKPNLVFALIDDFGALGSGQTVLLVWQSLQRAAGWLTRCAVAGHGDLGYHNVLNENLIKTPALDRLAATGIKLEGYYVQPICTPTRSQLMSGRYQIHTGLQHGVINPTRPMGLPTNIPIIANVLKDLGYRTHLVGKVRTISFLLGRPPPLLVSSCHANRWWFVYHHCLRGGSGISASTRMRPVRGIAGLIRPTDILAVKKTTGIRCETPALTFVSTGFRSAVTPQQ